MKPKEQYNNARYWQIGLFSLNNASTNLYLALMGYISYYANSIAGFGVMLISSLLTGLSIFDAVTDPVVGFLLDRKVPPFYDVRQSDYGCQFNIVVLYDA